MRGGWRRSLDQTRPFAPHHRADDCAGVRSVANARSTSGPPRMNDDTVRARGDVSKLVSDEHHGLAFGDKRANETVKTLASAGVRTEVGSSRITTRRVEIKDLGELD